MTQRAFNIYLSNNKLVCSEVEPEEDEEEDNEERIENLLDLIDEVQVIKNTTQSKFDERRCKLQSLSKEQLEELENRLKAVKEPMILEDLREELVSISEEFEIEF